MAYVITLRKYYTEYRQVRHLRICRILIFTVFLSISLAISNASALGDLDTTLARIVVLAFSLGTFHALDVALTIGDIYVVVLFTLGYLFRMAIQQLTPGFLNTRSGIYCRPIYGHALVMAHI